MSALRLAVVGGGWAGLAAAVSATQAGHHVTLWEAARTLGGRARALPVTLPDGRSTVLDNGQHILIGAYSETLALMRTLGLAPESRLLRMPLALLFPDGEGLRLPDWPTPLDVLAGVLGAQGWSLADKWSLLRTTAAWQRAGFACADTCSVSDLCQGLSPTVLQTLIEPLCVSALNTPPEQASAQVFLRVLKDALLGGKGSSNLLLPTRHLSDLLPDAAATWLQAQGTALRLGQRVTRLQRQERWMVEGEPFDAVIWATDASGAAQRIAQASADAATHAALQRWSAQAAALRYESIATVYLQAHGVRLPQPLLALRSSAEQPAQFVFDRGALGGPAGLLAFVVSASNDTREALQAQVLHQAHSQLASLLQGAALQPVQTVVEKRATFACTPGLLRPAQAIAPGLLACGDYVAGPYPATLEGAVRSGLAAGRAVEKAL